MKQQIEYWRKSAPQSWKTAMVLYDNKRYDACLFFCHLAIEKLLKGLVVIKTNQVAPKIHDLAKLANLANLKLSDEQLNHLKTITTFNIAGRYEEEKYAFYKKCTKAFTQKHLSMCKPIFLWLQKQYPKK